MKELKRHLGIEWQQRHLHKLVAADQGLRRRRLESPCGCCGIPQASERRRLLVREKPFIFCLFRFILGFGNIV